MTKIEQRFVEAAHALANKLGVFHVPEDIEAILAIARALQDAADKARDDENRACYQELERMASRYVGTMAQDDNGYRVLLAAMDEVAARRGPG